MNPWMAWAGSLVLLAVAQLGGTQAILWLARSGKKH
jgi:hypothetical protein